MFDTKRFLKIGKKLTSHNKYDAIISFSGVFSAHNAAYLLSKQTKIPLFLFYADPFSSNFVLRNKNQHSLFKLEEKWIHQSQLVFLPKNYHTEYSNLFVNYLDKFVECELPGFFNDEELHTINHTPVQKELIVYAGDFFQRFREPLNFIKLAQLFPNFKFIVLGCLNAKSCQKITIPKNICIVGRLTKDKYLKTIGAAQALFLEDNVFPNQIPYKAFEYISTGKPIIYSTKNKESSASKLLENYDRLVVFDNEQFDKDDFLKKISINCTNFTLSDYYDKYKTCFVSDIILKSIEKQLDI